MNILVLEPFMGGSHKAFLKGIEKNSRHRIFPLTMDDRFWKWRMHGGSLSLYQKSKAVKEEIDLIFASSMTDLPAFMALTNPRFAFTPVVMYMHENQLTQPLPEGEIRDSTYCYINYLSAMVADRLIFSSRFHYESYFDALPGFLSQFPDHHHSDTIEQIKDKSSILHPGIDLKSFDSRPDTRNQNERPVVIWNQRWTFDKDPALFFRTMNRLDDAGFSFDLILAGDSRHDKPKAFEKACERYGDRIIHFGYVDDFDTYSKLLHRGNIVVSTATYEFFCLAIMEAVYCGCHPMLPESLTYLELIPDQLNQPLLHAPVFYHSEDELFHNLKLALSGESKLLPKTTLQKINRHLDWTVMIHQYDELFDVMIESKRRSTSDVRQ